MNPHFEITRYPKSATMKRGPNMARLFCQKCNEEKTHAYKFVEFVNPLQDRHTSWFVCDDCLTKSKIKSI